MRWDGSVAFVTGSSRGIGAAIARAAAAKGARVGLVARSKADLETVLESIGGCGAVATADVADRSELEAALGALERELGPPDILVNNAGIGAYGPVLETAVEEFERQIRVNYLSSVVATKAVLPGMVGRGRGHVVFLCSIAGRIGAPLEAAYSGSKFAMAGFAEALSIEVAGKGIGVSIIDPGPVETSFFEARGVPYSRKVPKPVSAEAVARDVISAVEGNKLERFVPRWLRFALVVKTLIPPAYRRGTLRDYRKVL